MTRDLLIQTIYLLSGVLFILGLKGLSSAKSARRGMQMAEVGMLLAIVGTLLHHDIVRYEWIVAGLAIGSAIGAAMAIFMPMTAMPQRIALSHAFGALAATLVGVAEYWVHGADVGRMKMAALGFEVLFGALTVTGSFMAFGKLQELVKSAPVVWPFQNVFNIALFFSTVLMFGYLVYDPSQATVFYVMIAASLLSGILLVLPIGGADMPVVISLLNSYAGLAAAATGFAIDNKVLIIAGALDGTSGFILSVIMSRAMNRSFTNVLFGAFGTPQAGAAAGAEGLTVRSISVEDAAVQLAYANSVIVIPGYGMAVARAQEAVREVAEQVEKRGGEVKFAIHPVAGRMPGHMNVLLAEANIPYDKLLEMEEVNPHFPSADVALVVGANDVVNPAARSDRASPIYGMPILNADQARSVIVLKRSMNPGFAGIENLLFYDDKTKLLFGDARASLTRLAQEMKNV